MEIQDYGLFRILGRFRSIRAGYRIQYAGQHPADLPNSYGGAQFMEAGKRGWSERRSGIRLPDYQYLYSSATLHGSKPCHTAGGSASP